MRQSRRSGAIVGFFACVLLLLNACSLSPLAGEDAQASVMDDLNFEVPKDRPVTRKDDPVDIGISGSGNQLTQPIIVTGLNSTDGTAPAASVDDGEAIYRVNFDNADLREATSSILG